MFDNKLRGDHFGDGDIRRGLSSISFFYYLLADL
jgi:hypothetical protein